MTTTNGPGLSSWPVRRTRGAAGNRTRVQRHSLKASPCDAAEDPDDRSDDRIWDQLQTRLRGTDGFQLTEGAVLERTVLPFRSFVQTPMRHGRLVLAGDAAHTVPPTGAKGLNLALSDVRLLAEVVERALGNGGDDALDT